MVNARNVAGVFVGADAPWVGGS